jgi:L-lysine 2,3-aminomutase
MMVKYITKIEQLERLGEREKAELKKVTDEFAFRANDYYLSLIDWDDPEESNPSNYNSQLAGA